MVQNTNTMSQNQQKDYFELSGEEHEAKAQQAVKDAIAKMHSKGVATVDFIDGRQYLHHPDGRLTPIENPQPQ